MRHPNWLTATAAVPHVPTLGPVHPDVDRAGCLAEVRRLPAGQFTRYDKDAWQARKTETVYAVEHGPGRTLVSTVDTRGAGRATLYRYAATPPVPAELAALRRTAADAAAAHQAASAQVVWCQHSDPAGPGGDVRDDHHWGTAAVHAVAAFLTTIGADLARDTEAAAGGVAQLRPEQYAVFVAFSATAGDDGMAYLGRRCTAGRLDGPVLIAHAHRQIVGAIGPLRVQPDAAGVPRLLPQYFAVAPGHRRDGHGRALWRAAQRWGAVAGARYQLMQAAPHTASAALYRSEGAAILGYVCRAAA